MRKEYLKDLERNAYFCRHLGEVEEGLDNEALAELGAPLNPFEMNQQRIKEGFEGPGWYTLGWRREIAGLEVRKMYVLGDEEARDHNVIACKYVPEVRSLKSYVESHAHFVKQQADRLARLQAFVNAP